MTTTPRPTATTGHWSPAQIADQHGRTAFITGGNSGIGLETARAEARVPMRRSGQPGDTTEAICFLLPDRAAYITGTHFSVDGGFLA